LRCIGTDVSTPKEYHEEVESWLQAYPFTYLMWYAGTKVLDQSAASIAGGSIITAKMEAAKYSG